MSLQTRRLGLRFMPLADHTFQRHSFCVEIRIDGRLLIDMVRDIEALYVTSVAGAYEPASPLHLMNDLDPERPADDPFLRAGHAGRALDLLICDCGIPSCWSLTARMLLDADRVRWTELESNLNHSQGVRYDGLGPLVFERASYVAEVRQLATAFADALKG